VEKEKRMVFVPGRISWAGACGREFKTLDRSAYGAFRHARSHVLARVHRVRHMFQSQWIQVGPRAERKLLRDLGVATRQPTRISHQLPWTHCADLRARKHEDRKFDYLLIDMTKIE
jgi:hypothetical protein